MEQILKYIKKNRELFISLVDSLSIEQLNKIPERFNNNIAWNFGHSIVSTEGLCYLHSKVEPEIKIPFWEKYSKGSKPENFISREEIDALKTLAETSLAKIEADVKTGKFAHIPNPFATHTYKYEMNTIEEFLTCCLTHEFLHYGVAVAMKKIV